MARPRAGSAARLEPPCGPSSLQPCPLWTLVTSGSWSRVHPAHRPSPGPRLESTQVFRPLQMLSAAPEQPLCGRRSLFVKLQRPLVRPRRFSHFPCFLVLREVAGSSCTFSSSWLEALCRDHVLGGVTALLCPCCWAFSADRTRTVFKIKYFMRSY